MSSARWSNWFSGNNPSANERKEQQKKANRNRRDRKVFFESLEDRRVLAIDFSTINTVANDNAFGLADFNGDGFTDFAMANSATNSVQVALRDAAGVVQSSSDYSVGTTPMWVTVGDFNNDGNSDLAVANLGSNNLSVLQGNGNGTFQAAANVNVGVAPTSVISGDFNSDGKLDLVSTNFGSNDLSVLGGNGNGTFQAAVSVPAGWRPLSASVVSSWGLFGGSSLNIAVNNLNTTSATEFSNETPTGTNAFAFSPIGGFPRPSEENIAAGDFNGDGTNDLEIGRAHV